MELICWSVSKVVLRRRAKRNYSRWTFFLNYDRLILRLHTIIVCLFMYNIYCNMERETKKKMLFYYLLWPWLKNTLVPLLGCCHGEWIWKTASYWCDPTRWDWCYLWGYWSTRKCQGNFEGVSYASFAKTWVVLQRTTYEGIYHSPNLSFVKILLEVQSFWNPRMYVCLFVEIGLYYILIILFPWVHCFSFDFVSHLLLGLFWGIYGLFVSLQNDFS